VESEDRGLCTSLRKRECHWTDFDETDACSIQPFVKNCTEFHENPTTVESEDRGLCTSLRKCECHWADFHETDACSIQRFVNNCTEFHENPTTVESEDRGLCTSLHKCFVAGPIFTKLTLSTTFSKELYRIS
jgi:hypothetical protein